MKLTDERIIDVYRGQGFPLEMADLIQFARAIEAACQPKWLPMKSAPKDGTPVLALCVHTENPYYLDNGLSLSPYGAHCEGLTHVQDGYHVVQFGGEYNSDPSYVEHDSIPAWWFRSGSNFEEPANPVYWMQLPEVK